MVFSPDDANLPDLGSILPNLGKLSADDGNDSLGLGGHHTNQFLKGWSFRQMTELIHPSVNKKLNQSIKRRPCSRVRLKGLLPMMSSKSGQAK
jgi:hypothetical protein